MITNVQLSNEDRKRIIRLGLHLDKADWFSERGVFKVSEAVRWLVMRGLEASERSAR